MIQVSEIAPNFLFFWRRRRRQFEFRAARQRNNVNKYSWDHIETWKSSKVQFILVLAFSKTEKFFEFGYRVKQNDWNKFQFLIKKSSIQEKISKLIWNWHENPSLVVIIVTKWVEALKCWIKVRFLRSGSWNRSKFREILRRKFYHILHGHINFFLKSDMKKVNQLT